MSTSTPLPLLLRRAAVATAAAAAALTSVPATALAAPLPLPLPEREHRAAPEGSAPGGPVHDPVGRPGDGAGAGEAEEPRDPEQHLTVAVHGAGLGTDGTYELTCHPTGGDHPKAKEACTTLDGQTRWGRDLFAPVSPGSNCTLQYGGPATAHVTGVWAGRPVDAHFNREDGCEIARWNKFVPLLPKIGS
ncbi:SSI family serine proteinase inhibitor [Streptomyces sp. SAJ15]|uniref:SSI family serine proteinase inhibitor n=1 Tax=Streptomyces sp. SAJ15 TaxID=2011095 RepID=UPI001186972F|nr:SSI family serine proteinase inhibitor [Streptomyces sp. SAJ15]TVL92287.1 hypothetical protein CD790_11280 [Streptomyces sp. SAJ15]